MAEDSTPQERESLETAIAALEAQRMTLGDAVVDASVGALRHQLADLDSRPHSQPRRSQQRKQITVLFADVSGFTSMSEQLDPEEISNMMNTLWQRLDAVICRYGGYIDKHIGDAVMALWGVKTAQETDPEMAIRAALALQKALALYRQEVGHDLAMRIGINTGTVLLGEVGSTAEFTAIGDTVNTADRLEKVAPVGQIVISHNTFQHVRGVFDVMPLEPVNVKGKREPLQVYIVKRAKARSFRTRRRGVEGVETRMIGRADHKAVLQEGLRSILNDGALKIITVSGEAGIGKSRLLYEFENWVDLQEKDVLLLRGRARQENQDIPFGLFRDMFAFRFNIQEDDPAPVVRRKLVDGFREAQPPDQAALPADEIEMRAHFAGHLLGYDLGASRHLAAVLDDPKQIRDRAFTYLQGYFRDASKSDPVLVLIEDLQWADESSLDMFADGALLLADLRLLVVATARPSFFQRRPIWLKDQVFHEQLPLRPLTRRQNRRLVYEILKLADDVPAELRDLIVDNSEGNPFYVEELIKMLIEEGAIVKGDERWRINVEDMSDYHVPVTLAGILQARLDTLSAVEKSVIQQASVVGRVFWDDAVARLNGGSQSPLERNAFEEALQNLRLRELVFKRDPSSFGQIDEYTFKHVILRDVAYESVLLSDRKRYHGQTADWLIAQGGDRSSELVGLTADHLIKAGRSDEAIDRLVLVGNQAAARFANEEAVAYFSRALDLTAEEDISTRYDILRKREKVYHVTGNRERQLADLEMLETLADLISPVKMANVALRRASYAEAISDYEAMISAARYAIACVTDDGPAAILARSYLEWGIAQERQGDYGASHEQLERALALSRQAGDQTLAGLALRGLGIVARALRRHALAYDYYREALEQFIEQGDLNAQASTLVWLGVLSTDLGDIAGARRYYEEALELARKTGYRYQESFALSNLGSNANYQGDYRRAMRFIEQALAVARQIDNRIVECLCLNNLGTVNLNLGDFEEALADYEQSLAIALDTGHRSMEASAGTGVGHSLIKQGDAAAAIKPLESALLVRRDLEEVHQFETQVLLACASQQMGDLQRARQEAEEILRYLEDDGRFYITEYGLHNYLYLIEVLDALGDPRTADVLRLAHAELEEEAARIPDAPTRRAFRNDVPFHGEIDALWQQRTA